VLVLSFSCLNDVKAVREDAGCIACSAINYTLLLRMGLFSLKFSSIGSDWVLLANWRSMLIVVTLLELLWLEPQNELQGIALANLAFDVPWPIK
jgi:hypothetical protein